MTTTSTLPARTYHAYTDGDLKRTLTGLFTSDPFKDGTHKHGGTIYAVNTFTDESEAGYKRVTLGCVARRNDFVILRGTTYNFGGKAYVIEPDGEDKRYLVNDWTAPAFIDGERQDNVTYFRTRKQAMAQIERIRGKL